MAFEIFIEPELQELEHIENSTEWQAICEELNLNGQLQHTTNSETKQAPPYMFIDPKTQRIIRTLCPRKVKADEYSASTIPLDVLKEIKRCKEHGWYAEVVIFYDDKTPDPFVVGFTHAEHTWNAHAHLIARWGAELIPFEIMEQKAIARLKTAVQEELYKLKSTVDFAYNNIEGFIGQMLSGKEAPHAKITINDLRGYNSELPF